MNPDNVDPAVRARWNTEQENAVHPNQKLANDQAAGLRALADMIEANPEMAKHAGYLDDTNVFWVRTKDDIATIARAALAHGFEVKKNAFADTYKVLLKRGPVGFTILADRGEVCERVVTGVETITRTVKDPHALAAVPEVEVTETVETVEWVCKPLLATREENDRG